MKYVVFKQLFGIEINKLKEEDMPMV